MNVNNLLEKGVKLHNGWYYYAGEYYLILSEDDIRVYPRIEDTELYLSMEKNYIIIGISTIINIIEYMKDEYIIL